MGYQKTNPFDDKVLNRFEQLTDQQLEAAIAATAALSEKWRLTSFAERAAIAAEAALPMSAQSKAFAGPVTL